MQTDHLLLEELTRDEARQLAPEALLVWPVGTLEQHGPHLPVRCTQGVRCTWCVSCEMGHRTSQV